MSLRQDGAQMPGIVRKFLGGKTFQVYNIFLCILMLLVGAVFTYTPGAVSYTHLLPFDEQHRFGCPPERILALPVCVQQRKDSQQSGTDDHNRQ